MNEPFTSLCLFGTFLTEYLNHYIKYFLYRQKFYVTYEPVRHWTTLQIALVFPFLSKFIQSCSSRWFYVPFPTSLRAVRVNTYVFVAIVEKNLSS